MVTFRAMLSSLPKVVLLVELLFAIIDWLAIARGKVSLFGTDNRSWRGAKGSKGTVGKGDVRLNSL